MEQGCTSSTARCIPKVHPCQVDSVCLVVLFKAALGKMNNTGGVMICPTNNYPVSCALYDRDASVITLAPIQPNSLMYRLEHRATVSKITEQCAQIDGVGLTRMKEQDRFAVCTNLRLR
jgi:hypothetical protein